MAQPRPQPWHRTQRGLELLRRISDNDGSLREVGLSYEVLGDDGARRLAAALDGNTNVYHMGLVGNNIGDDGVTDLAGALRDNTTVTHLALGGNRIRDGGAEALARMAHRNSAIRYLILGANHIEEGGGRALAIALIHNSTLGYMYLGGNSIGDGGAEALACAICLNPSLNHLGLRRNGIGERGARALATAMRVLGGEGIGREDAAVFAEGLFAETSPVRMGPEELGAIKQHLAAGNYGKGKFELASGLVGVPWRVKRAGQRNLMRAVVGNGMVRAAVSETEDHAVLMIVEKAGMANGVRSIFEIITAKPGLFKFS